MKGFILISDDLYVNESIIKEIKDYPDKTKIFTIYGEKYVIEKEKKHGRK